MKLKVQLLLKRIIIAILCVVTTSGAIISSIPLAKADSSLLLGTNKALGSPILNNNATIDNWNKWEMVCWGVFLSNFCQPLIDNYESAFQTTGTGSNGKGYQALSFGSGSDATNDETIRAFCSQAITYQNQIQKKQVYVGFTKVDNGVIGDKPDVDGLKDDLRQANFNDFFLESEEPSEDAETKSWIIMKDDLKFHFQGSSSGAGTIPILNLKEGYLPTFYIKGDSGKYVEVLDYTDGWDLQMMAAIYNSVNDEQKDNFSTNFDNYYTGTDSYPITMDAFGNLIVDNKVMFPSCANQHITEKKSINIMNSWIVNSYNSTYNNDRVVQGLKQANASWSMLNSLGFTGSCGVPAFGNTEIGQVGFLYFDTDSALINANNDANDHYGQMIRDLFDCSIESTQNPLPLKFEIAGSALDNGWKAAVLNEREPLQNTLCVAQAVANCSSTSTPEILSYLEYMDGTKVKLFDSDPIAVAVKVELDSNDEAFKNAKAIRTFWNFLYEVYRGKYNENTKIAITKTSLDAILMNSQTILDLGKNLDEDEFSVWEAFKAVYTDYADKKMPDPTWDWNGNESFKAQSSRICLVYPVSKVLKNVSSVLGVKDGTEFSVYSPYIYITYLDWYGVINKTTLTSGTDPVSNFNTDIFSPEAEVLTFDPSTVSEIKSEKEKESEVLQLSYLMLHPTDGRSYRKELIYNGITDFLYEQYNRIVFGGRDSIYNGSSSKSNSGFLAVETYSDNFLTGWFLKNYTDIAVLMIGACVIAIVVIGLLKSRKLSWFLMSIFTVVNVILIVPSSGEITPYVTSMMTQNMFSSKMTYWGIAEGIANASLEATNSSQDDVLSGLTSEESTQVMTLVKQLQGLYTDRSLMLKQDISQKITQKLGGVYTEIQSLQSTRWILPTIMQQYSADDQHVNDFVYVKLSNVWDDGSNLYWYYSPEDASFVTKETATSGQFWRKTTSGGADNETIAKVATDDEKYTGLSPHYKDYESEDWGDDPDSDINYANYAYSYKENKELVHLYSWYNPNVYLEESWKSAMGDFSEYKNADSWDKYINFEGRWGTTKKEYYKNTDEDRRYGDVTSSYNNWDTMNGSSTSFENIADQYNRIDTTTLKPGYSFYKTTESPYYYFFNVVKDTFPSDATFGSVIGRLQGQIEEDADGNKVRSNFMYATVGTESEDIDGIHADAYTPYVRDVADLQELFTNVIPYLYATTIYTGGFDGESGILLDTKISDASQYYKGINQSWVYRCNWAVKIVENPKYSKPAIAYTEADEKRTVNCPVIPYCYTEQPDGPNRDMIFSEAQMHARGLKENDLTIVELKCIKVNKEIAKKWTLLINYAGTGGMTKEVLYREMATIATNEFCKEFSTSGVADNKYSIYPQSLDLRYLSFDSIMKLLMINVSKDTSYVYGDTMSKLLEDTDMFTAILLLIAAFMCAYIIPLIRCILMAMIFYLGFLAIIRALFSSAQYKGKIACGQLVSNLLFMVYTLAYYACFCALMALSSSDEVLSVNNIQATPGNPVWMLIAVIGFSGVYIYLMCKQIAFCFAHYRDMGFEVYSTVASAVTGKLQDAIGGLGDKFNDWMSGESTSTSISTSNTNSIKGTGVMNRPTQDVNVLSVNSQQDDNENDNDDTTFTPAYESGNSDEFNENASPEAIDAQIRAGEQMNSDS